MATIRVDAVRSVSPVGSWWRDVRGWRVGLTRGAPAVKIGLSGAKYDELLISTPDAASITRTRAAH